MDSLIFSFDDITTEAKHNQEKFKEQRRNNYTYHTYLSNYIIPFKKRNIKRKNKQTKKFINSYVHSQFKCYSASSKSTILNEETLVVNSSQQEIDQSELFNWNLDVLQEKCC